jgi:hypothetical protein
MSSYIKATNFFTKDALLSGDPFKIIKGAEIDNEYNALAIAINSKADTTSPTFAGEPKASTPTAGTNNTQIATTAFVQNIAGNLGTMSAQNSNTIAVTGGTINATNIATLGTNALNNKTISTGSPTGGVDGDIWYKYL